MNIYDSAASAVQIITRLISHLFWLLIIFTCLIFSAYVFFFMEYQLHRIWWCAAIFFTSWSFLRIPYIGRYLLVHEGFRYGAERLATLFAFFALILTVVTDQNAYAQGVLAEKRQQLGGVLLRHKDASEAAYQANCGMEFEVYREERLKELSESVFKEDRTFFLKVEKVAPHFSEKMASCLYLIEIMKKFGNWGEISFVEVNGLPTVRLHPGFDPEEYVRVWEEVVERFPDGVFDDISWTRYGVIKDVVDLASEISEAERAFKPGVEDWLKSHLPLALSFFGAVSFALQRRADHVG